MWWHPDQFEKRAAHLQKRAAMVKQIRSWFDGEGFTEVQTPALQVMGTADTHIQAFETDGLTLHTSPEIAMKKLLVAGAGDIYQICNVFRKNEQGRLHAQEFTMLEWYRTDADYTAMMQDCENLLAALGFDSPCEKITVAEAFERYAKTDINGDLKDTDIRIAETDEWEDIFHAIMAEKIEPHLGQGTPTILYDYPARLAALAKTKGDVAERFELYINGIEIANAYSELTDPVEQCARLEADLQKKEKLYGQKIPLDEDFIRALEYGLPDCAGCALGLDRLVMLACGVDDIEDVLWAGKI